MSHSPFIPFYTSDFLGGTGGMTAATKGVYITLLCLMYEAEKPLAQSWDILARRCGCTLPAFKNAVQSLVDDNKASVSSEGIWSQTCDKHIAQRRERSGSAKAAAKTRWEKDKQKQCSPDASASVPQCKPEPEPEPYKKEEDTYVSSVVSLPDRSSECLAHFNAIARRVGWPEVQKFTPPRRAALSQRIADVGGVDAWMDAITRASSSPLLTGQNNRSWRADFDWLSKAANFTKLMEGNYDPRTSNANPAHVPQHRADPALEQALRLAGIGPTPRDVGYGN
jgi:uncharacterized protein YdaU (DUF1376 family)